MRGPRNFGYFSSPKPVWGFCVTFKDGTQIDHQGGLITLPLEMIREHGGIQKAKAI